MTAAGVPTKMLDRSEPDERIVWLRIGHASVALRAKLATH
jgi:hypothetical protein